MDRRFLIGALGVTLAVAVALFTPGHTVDFGFDWLTAKAFVTGIDPYQPVDQLAALFGSNVVDGVGVIHPRTPGALLMQSPVGWVPIEHGYMTGRLLTILSFVGFMWVVAKLSALPVHWLYLAMAPLLFVWPFSTVLPYGQTGFLVAALIGYTWILARRSDTLWAGVPLAVAVSFKMWPWLVVPALWLAGYRKTAYGAAGGFAALNLAGLAFPHVSLSGAVTALTQAEVIPSLSLWTGTPAWVGAAVGLTAVVVMARHLTPETTVLGSVVVALAVAPMLWANYLVVLGVVAVAIRGQSHQSESSGTVPERQPLPLQR